MKRTLFALLLATFVAHGVDWLLHDPVFLDAQAQELEEAPPGVEMLIKRGQIPAIFEPKFVPAAVANLPDDAWILGIHIGGEAHAYSLNLLNHHEVVNDYVGGAPVAAVW